MNKKCKKVVASIIVLMMLLLTAFTLTSCQTTKGPDKLYVGMDGSFAPFSYTQTDDANGAIKFDNAEGYANGYDVMIAQQIADELGKELVIVKYEFDALLTGIVSNTIDLVLAGMSPTADRKEAVDFSLPYYESQLVIVVRKDGNYANATKLADFGGAKIVAQLGTFHDKALQEQCANYGIVRQTPMDTLPAMVNALNTKAVDGYVAEEPGAIATCQANDNLTYIHLVNNSTGFTASAEDVQIAVAFNKNSAYAEQINTAIANISQEERDEMMQVAIQLSVGDNIAETPTEPTETSKNFFVRMANIFVDYADWLWKGVVDTMFVALVSTLIGLLLGLLVGVYRTMPTPQSKFLKILKKIGDLLTNAYLEIFRGTPMMVQAMVIFWGYALINNGITMNVVFAGILVVSVNTGAYMAEIVRSGIISIDKGQFEGAYAIGMTHNQTMWKVVIPQCLRNILPSVSNEFVLNIKDTSVLNVIGFTELFFQAKSIVTINFDTFGTYLAIAIIYFVLTFSITRILRWIERKMEGKKDYEIPNQKNTQKVGGGKNV